MRRVVTLLGLSVMLALLAVVAGCAKQEADVSEPGKAVQEFYRLLNEKQYAQAKSMYSAEARAVFDDPDVMPEEGFHAWVDTETKSGTIAEVKIVASVPQESGDVDVEAQILFDDGSTATRNIHLTQEDGAWKLGLVT